MSEDTPPEIQPEQAEEPKPAPKPVVEAAPEPKKPIKEIKSQTQEFTVSLPCGVVSDGKVYRNLTLRTINVGDRRLFGEEQTRSNPGKITTRLIQSKLVSIEGLPSFSDKLLKSMLAFDRDFVVYALRRETTHGKPFFERFQCHQCGAMNQVEIPLDELEGSVREMSDEVALRRNERDRVLFDVVLEDYGFRGTFVYPDGGINEHIGELYHDDANIFDIEMDILGAICVDFNGEGKYSPQQFRELNIDFLDDLQEAIQNQAYGYDFSPPQRCYKCKTDNAVKVEILDFLFEGLRRDQTRKKRTSPSV